MVKYQQNDVSAMRSRGQDLSERWQEILKIISKKTGFTPDRNILRHSEWWKTGKIGAVHVSGVLEEQNLRAVLKIQGTRPKTSESLMIQNFSSQNKSKIVRPPKVYKVLEWDDFNSFEAIILEEVVGPSIIGKRPATKTELNHFFDVYKEYKNKCVNKPWIARPSNFSYRKQLSVWKDSVKKQSLNDEFKSDEDHVLVENAISLIENSVTPNQLEFMHGHFQPGDLILTKDQEVVLFSNLFWSWRIPFYDAVFAYHWWMLGMEHIPNLTNEVLEVERDKWKQKIYSLSNISTFNFKRLLDIAFLERSVAAMDIDRFMNDQALPASKIIYDGIRTEIKVLLHKLQ